MAVFWRSFSAERDPPEADPPPLPADAVGEDPEADAMGKSTLDTGVVGAGPLGPAVVVAAVAVDVGDSTACGPSDAAVAGTVPGLAGTVPWEIAEAIAV